MYGKSLLQYAIQQNSVLGNRAAEESTVIEETESRKCYLKALLGGSHLNTQFTPLKEDAAASNPRFHFEGEPDLREVEPEGEETAGDDENEEGAGDHDEEEGNQEGEGDEFNDAWDVLDIARVMYEKEDSPEAKAKLADVYVCLGDVSLETEKFDQALPDFRAAIDIKQTILEPDNRELAELHYKLALALEYSKQHLAVEETEKAVKVLRKRLEVLQDKQLAESGDKKGKGKSTEKDVDQDANQNTEIQKEIKEIQELIPDMEVKIEELKNPKQLEAQVDMLKEMLGLKGSSGGLPAVPVPANVNDLTSLVKKSKSDGAASENTQAQDEDKLKKPKLDDI
jgi:HAT1-interacting factor 1